MSNRWIIFLASVWIFGMFLGASFDKAITTEGYSGTQESTMEFLLNAKNISYAQDELGTMSFVGINPEYFRTFWNMMIWDFSFFENHPEAEIVRYLIMVPITAGMVWGFLYVFTQIFQSILSAITGA